MVDELQNRGGERIGFLLADFGSIKAEIARRSGLQERAIALYFVAVAFVALRIVDSERVSFAIPALWTVTWLTVAFCGREHLEIIRLGRLIRDRIAKPASDLLSCRPDALIPSELDAGDPQIDSSRRVLGNAFNWVAFVAIPVALTALAVAKRWPQIEKLKDLGRAHPWLALVSMIPALDVARLLGRIGRRATISAAPV